MPTPFEASVSILRRNWDERCTRLLAVTIGIIAAEQGVASISTEDLLVVPNGLPRRSVPKVLPVVSRVVAETEDVLFGMLS